MTTQTGTEEPRRDSAPRLLPRPGRTLLAVLLVVAVVVGGLIWRSAGQDAAAPATATAPSASAQAAADAVAPREVSVEELRAYATGTRGLYWAGEVPDRRIELTTTSDNRSYVRYLPPQVPLGDRQPAYTTVATYPQPDAHGLLTGRAEAGDQRADVASGGLATWSADRPTSVYLAYPGYDYLVEVFDPDAARARELVVSSAVRPVD